MNERTERDIARAMSAAGDSYRKIKRELGISTGTVSKWCSDIVQPRLAAKIEANRLRREERARTIVPKPQAVKVQGEPPFNDYDVYFPKTPKSGIPIVRMAHRESGIRQHLYLERYRASIQFGRQLGRREVIKLRDGSYQLVTPVPKLPKLSNHKPTEPRECVMCVVEFVPPKGSKRDTCSDQCWRNLMGMLRSDNAREKRGQ